MRWFFEVCEGVTLVKRRVNTHRELAFFLQPTHVFQVNCIDVFFSVLQIRRNSNFSQCLIFDCATTLSTNRDGAKVLIDVQKNSRSSESIKRNAKGKLVAVKRVVYPVAPAERSVSYFKSKPKPW